MTLDHEVVILGDFVGKLEKTWETGLKKRKLKSIPVQSGHLPEIIRLSGRISLSEFNGDSFVSIR
jgi:hypothetical protein